MLISPESTIASVKRKWGQKIIPGKSMTPEQVSADILIHLRDVAEEASGENFSKAVITVPAYYNDAQRTSTKRAAEIRFGGGKCANLRLRRLLMA